MKLFCRGLIKSALLVVTLFGLTLAHADKLVVGVNPEYRPLVFKEAGEVTGIEPATASAAAEILKRDLVIREMAWDDLIPALQSGEIDAIMSGMSITDERKAEVDFSRSYLTIGQMAVIRASDLQRFAAPASMFQPGVRIGVEPDTTGETYARETLAAANVKTFTNPGAGFEALRAGDIDFFIHDAPTSWKIAQDAKYGDLFALYRPLTKEHLAWAVKKGNTALLSDLNQALAQLEANGKLRMIQDHWMPVKVQVGN